LGHGYPFTCIKRCVKISTTTLRKFFLHWCESLASLKSEYIYLPRTPEELEKVQGEYKAVGYPGCLGSIDAVKIGWDKCPHKLNALYNGKEGYPTVGFQVSCTQRKFVQTIGKVEPGTRNDMTTVRYEETVVAMHSGNHKYKRTVWYTYDIQGNPVEHRGLYWICDGGYLRWPCLICGDKNSSNPLVAALAGIHGGVRKDVECLFGILKQRFRWLKHWNELHEVSDVNNVFVTCCILHNILLQHDGYVDEDIKDLDDSFRGRMAKKFKDDMRGDCLQIPQPDPDAAGAPDLEEPDLGIDAETAWRRRVDAIAVHQTYLIRKNKLNYKNA
jgi:hypothetical protein